LCRWDKLECAIRLYFFSYYSMNIKKIVSEEDITSMYESNKWLLFKKSPTCSLSRKAREEFETFFASNDVDWLDIFRVDVINERPLSLQIAQEVWIKHESPQVLLWKTTTVVKNASHLSITQWRLADILLGWNDTRE